MNQLKHSVALACDGFQAGVSVIPSFEVGPGEIVKIVFPSQHSSDMHIAEQMIYDQACRNGRAATVELAMQPSPWKEMFHRQTTAEWLIAKTGMSREEAVEILNRVQIKPDVPLSFRAGNPRWMLGFLAAMHQRPDVLVFTTTGCDAMGRQRALKEVRSQLQDTAALYLSCFPDLDISEPEFAAVLEVKSNCSGLVA